MIGDLNKRVTIQYPSKTADGMGGFTSVWTDSATVWGAIWPMAASERLQSMQQAMEITHRIRIRYRTSISPEWRIKFGSRYFNISGIINLREKNEFLELLCKEVQ